MAQANKLKELEKNGRRANLCDYKASRQGESSSDEDTATLKPLAKPLPAWEHTAVVLVKRLPWNMSTGAGHPCRRPT